MLKIDTYSYKFDRLIASIIIILIGVFGLYFNGCAFLKLYSARKSASFHKFCISHSVSNIGVLCFMIFFTAPMIYTQNTDISHSLVGKIIGQIAVLLWDVGVYSHLFVSFNRLLVIRFPLSGARLLSDRVTSCMVIAVWIVGTLHALPYFYYPSCYLWFTPEIFTWEFGPTVCGRIIATWGDLYTGLFVFSVTAFFDIFTLIYLRNFHETMHRMTVSNRNNHKREVRFFMQSVVQFSLFTVKFANFYLVSQVFSDKWGWFFTMTVAWESCHALDGLVLLIFHKVQRKQMSVFIVGHSSRSTR